MPPRCGNLCLLPWFCVILIATPISGNSSSGLGAVASADRAHIGTASAYVGTVVFAGDELNTEQAGSLQVRAGTARLLLKGYSPSCLGHRRWSP
jgi:hypothetical protein